MGKSSTVHASSKQKPLTEAVFVGARLAGKTTNHQLAGDVSIPNSIIAANEAIIDFSTEEMYDKKLREYKERQGQILVDMRIHSDADEEFYLTANMVLNVAKRALEIFESSEVNEKRQFLNYLLQNCRLSGKNLAFTLRSPFDKVVATASQPIGLRALELFRTAIWQIPGNISPFKIVNYW